MHIITGFVGWLALLACAQTPAADFRFSGSIGAELRWFPEDPQFADQFDHYQPSAVLEPEFRWRFNKGHQITLIPLLRLDGQDHKRTHFDLREAYWRRVGEQWDVLIGLNKVYWGVTESRHLVDMINQVDGVEDIDEEDRLGQPMINVSTQRSWGSVDLFLLTGFRERTFAGSDGRPRSALPVDTDDATYESGAEDKHIDYAVRYTHVLGDWDIGAQFFYGTGREPHFTVSPNNTRLIPNYDIITQFGTGGRWPRRPTLRLGRRSSVPSWRSSRITALSWMRAPPSIRKARAISRLPTGPGLSSMKARISSLVGNGLAPAFALLAPDPAAVDARFFDLAK